MTELDFKFFFFPWWRCPEYRLDPDGVLIDSEFAEYFEELKNKHHIELDDEQRAWYAKKLIHQQDDMKLEYLSTPDEAFEASIVGSYYAKLLRKSGRRAGSAWYPTTRARSCIPAGTLGSAKATPWPSGFFSW
jgi:hypothetical protein